MGGLNLGLFRLDAVLARSEIPAAGKTLKWDSPFRGNSYSTTRFVIKLKSGLQ